MNNPQSPFRWWLAKNVGPELVALALTVGLAIVLLLVVAGGGSSGDGGRGLPSPSPDRGASGSTLASPLVLRPYPGRGDDVKYHHPAGQATPVRSHLPV